MFYQQCIAPHQTEPSLFDRHHCREAGKERGNCDLKFRNREAGKWNISDPSSVFHFSWKDCRKLYLFVRCKEMGKLKSEKKELNSSLN
jgi:hypothetical protein